MQFLVLLLCPFVFPTTLSWSPFPSKMSATIHRKCQEKIGSSDEDIRNARMGNFNYENEKQTCYLHCTLNEISVMDEKGRFTPKKALKNLPPPTILEFGPAIAKCGHIETEDPCLKAMKIYECIFNKFRRVYFVP